MTAAFAEPPEPGRPPFANASPAQIRAALVPGDAAEFDRQWREAMARATERLDLSEVHEVLESWRRVAWLTTVHGRQGYQRMMAAAEVRLRTGERAAGGVPWRQLRAELGLGD